MAGTTLGLIFIVVPLEKDKRTPKSRKVKWQTCARHTHIKFEINNAILK